MRVKLAEDGRREDTEKALLKFVEGRRKGDYGKGDLKDACEYFLGNYGALADVPLDARLMIADELYSSLEYEDGWRRWLSRVKDLIDSVLMVCSHVTSFSFEDPVSGYVVELSIQRSDLGDYGVAVFHSVSVEAAGITSEEETEGNRLFRRWARSRDKIEFSNPYTSATGLVRKAKDLFEIYSVVLDDEVAYEIWDEATYERFVEDAFSTLRGISGDGSSRGDPLSFGAAIYQFEKFTNALLNGLQAARCLFKTKKESAT